MTTLYIVGTPIGNLKDITFRALEILKSVDLILCEDTRETKKLLDCHNIKNSAVSYHQHSRLNKIEYIVRILGEGKSVALVSDAGTPGISDPGNQLIAKLDENNLAVDIVPIPGASALAAAASVAGFAMNKFVFLGFPPAKRKRKKFFKEIVSSKYPVIFYESPHRIIKSLSELAKIDKMLEAVVCRELTKKFETIYRGKIEDILKNLSPRGEFVVIVKNK